MHFQKQQEQDSQLAIKQTEPTQPQASWHCKWFRSNKLSTDFETEVSLNENTYIVLIYIPQLLMGDKVNKHGGNIQAHVAGSWFISMADCQKVQLDRCSVEKMGSSMHTRSSK